MESFLDKVKFKIRNRNNETYLAFKLAIQIFT